MANDRKQPRRGGGWPVGATIAAGSTAPSYTGLYGGTDSLIGQNGYAGTGSLSSAQFGDGGSASMGMGDAGGGGMGDGGGGASGI
jgi:hypothetical protein